MCDYACIRFVAEHLHRQEVAGRRVLEVGSRVVNGSVRASIEQLQPSEYVGVDIEHGPGVDVICRVEDIREKFGSESFDVVVTTEVLEHIRDWRAAISAVKAVCRPGGTILITTRSKGFPYHAFPYDYWRYEQSDMKVLFADCEIQALESDSNEPGVFVKVRRPTELAEADLGMYQLHSIIHGQRVKDVSDSDLTWLALLPMRIGWAIRWRATRLRQRVLPSYR